MHTTSDEKDTIGVESISEVRMATSKRVFTLRLSDDVFEKIGALATAEHRSMTNYIEYVLLKHIQEVEEKQNEEPS